MGDREMEKEILSMLETMVSIPSLDGEEKKLRIRWKNIWRASEWKCPGRRHCRGEKISLEK